MDFDLPLYGFLAQNEESEVGVVRTDDLFPVDGGVPVPVTQFTEMKERQSDVLGEEDFADRRRYECKGVPHAADHYVLERCGVAHPW